MTFRFLSQQAAPIPIDVMAYRSDRPEVKPFLSVAHGGRRSDWLLGRGISIMARSHYGRLHAIGRRYVCSPSLHQRWAQARGKRYSAESVGESQVTLGVCVSLSLQKKREEFRRPDLVEVWKTPLPSSLALATFVQRNAGVAFPTTSKTRNLNQWNTDSDSEKGKRERRP